LVWVSTIINGAMLGGLYGLFGVGLALVFGVTRIVNIAHGEFIALSAFIGLGMANIFPNLHPVLLVIPAAIVSFALGYLLQALLINRAIKLDDPIAPLLLTFGISVIVRNLMAESFGVSPRMIRHEDFAQSSVDVAGMQLGLLPIVTLFLAVILFLGLEFLLKRTEIGRVVRATADNSRIARLMGVQPTRVYSLVMGLSFALAAVAGVLLSMRTTFTPFSGVERLLISFEVVVLGGLGSFWGAMLGGIALGIAQLVGLRLNPNADFSTRICCSWPSWCFGPTAFSGRGYEKRAPQIRHPGRRAGAGRGHAVRRR
jgi:branched-chain amino acid transport system permease protein